jgi:hypothetical protein
VWVNAKSANSARGDHAPHLRSPLITGSPLAAIYALYVIVLHTARMVARRAEGSHG